MSIEIIKRTLCNHTIDRLPSIVVLLYLQGLFGAVREVSDNLFHAAGNLAGCHDAMAALGMILQPATRGYNLYMAMDQHYLCSNSNSLDRENNYQQE